MQITEIEPRFIQQAVHLLLKEIDKTMGILRIYQKIQIQEIREINCLVSYQRRLGKEINEQGVVEINKASLYNKIKEIFPESEIIKKGAIRAKAKEINLDRLTEYQDYQEFIEPGVKLPVYIPTKNLVPGEALALYYGWDRSMVEDF